MSVRRQLRAIGALGALTAAVLGCSNPELRCIAEACQVVQAVVADNIITTRGKVCTLDPGTSSYPYRIILVIDVSKSNNTSDPQHGRPAAVLQAFTENYQKPGVSFALITFSEEPTDEIPGFTDDLAVIQSKLARTDRAVRNTNYVDTLAMVQQVIQRDLDGTDPAVRPFVKYDVQWLSDGNPEDVSPTDDPKDVANVCTPKTTRQAVQTAVNALVASVKTLNYFSLKLSTIYLDWPSDAGTPYKSQCVVMGPVEKWADGDVYLKEMLRGGGTFQRLMSKDLKFDIKVEPVTHSYEQHSFFLTNYSRVLGKKDGKDVLLPDSDQDGIADDVEKTTTMTDPLVADTGGIGCTDRLLQLYGIDNPGTCEAICGGQKPLPTDPTDPNAAMVMASDDNDHDSLLACAETILRSSDRRPDSDSDEIPDSIELRFGTRLDQAFRVGDDTDLDGISDIDEIRLGLDPRMPQADKALAYTYLPLTDATSDSPSISCYTFEVQNVQLVQTQATKGTAIGENNLCLTMVQHLRDSPNSQPTVTQACKSAFFETVDGVAMKTPANGVITFAPEDFKVVMCLGDECNQKSPTATPATDAATTSTAPAAADGG